MVCGKQARYCVLLQSVGSSCVDMYDLLLPIICYSTSVHQAAHVYLCEDALDLWLATVQCSPTISPSLLDLYSNMPAVFGWCTHCCYNVHFSVQ